MTAPAVALLKKLQACLHKEFNCSSCSSMVWSGVAHCISTPLLKEAAFALGLGSCTSLSDKKLERRQRCRTAVPAAHSTQRSLCALL